MHISSRRLLGLGFTLAVALTPGLARADNPPPGAIIGNGTVALGVDSDAAVGMLGTAQPADIPSALSSSCACTAWDVTAVATPTDGSAQGSSNRSVAAFTFNGADAVSTVVVGDPPSGTQVLRVTHAFHPAAGSQHLYEVNVLVENLTGAPVQVGYSRTIGWPAAALDAAAPIDPALGTLEPAAVGQSARFDVNAPPLDAFGSQAFRLYLGVASTSTDEVTAGLRSNGANLISAAPAADGAIVFGYAPGAGAVSAVAADAAPGGGPLAGVALGGVSGGGGGGGGGGSRGGSGGGGGGAGGSSTQNTSPVTNAITFVGKLLSFAAPTNNANQVKTTNQSPADPGVSQFSSGPFRQLDGLSDPVTTLPKAPATPELDSLTLSASGLAAAGAYYALRLRLWRRNPCRQQDQQPPLDQ